MKTIKKKANEASNSLKVKKVGATQHLKSGRKKRKNDIFSSCHRTTEGTAVATCKNEQEKYFVMLQFTTVSGSLKRICVPMDIALERNKLKSFLSNEGFPLFMIDAEIKEIYDLLKVASSPYHLFQTNGYHPVNGKTSFVLGSRIIPSNAAFVANNESEWCTASGKSEGQKELLKNLAGSPPALLAVGMAFLAPLISILGVDSFGLLFFGRSSSGKSKLLYLATSIYGHREKLPTWYATDNALQEEAERNNDLFTILDEGRTCESDFKQVAKRISRLSYTLTSGVSKRRSKTYIELDRQNKNWNSLFLCTNEHSLRELSLASETKRDAGETLRMIDIPVDYGDTPEGGRKGIFKDLPAGQQSGARLIKKLEKSVSVDYGYLGLHYLRLLISLINKGEKELLKQRLERYIQFFLAEEHIRGKGGYAERLALRFGLIYAALIFAAENGFVPWNNSKIFASVNEMYHRTLDYATNPRDLVKLGMQSLTACLENKRIFAIQQDTTLQELQNAYDEGMILKSKGTLLLPSKKLTKFFGSEAKAQGALTALADCILNEKKPDGWSAVRILPANEKSKGFRKRCVVLSQAKLLERLGLA